MNSDILCKGEKSTFFLKKKKNFKVKLYTPKLQEQSNIIAEKTDFFLYLFPEKCVYYIVFALMG